MVAKLEKKCHNATEEYSQAVEKYNACKVEFEQRYADSCSLFQMHEEMHLSQMRTFLFTYTQLVAQLNATRQKNFTECQHKMNNVYTVDALIEQFVVAKGTGQDRPSDAEFVEYQASTAMCSSSYEMSTSVTTPNGLNKRRSLTSPVNDVNATYSNSNSNMGLSNTPPPPSVASSGVKEAKKNADSKGFSIFNIR